MPTDPVNGPGAERVGAAAKANRWFSPAKTSVGAVVGCVVVVLGLVASMAEVALVGVTWLALVAAGKFILAVLGNAYVPQEKRYQHGFYASLFGTDSKARHSDNAGDYRGER